jgi:hypothetical protein
MRIDGSWEYDPMQWLSIGLAIVGLIMIAYWVFPQIEAMFPVCVCSCP